MKTRLTIFCVFICYSLTAQQRFTIEANAGLTRHGNTVGKLNEMRRMPGETATVSQDNYNLTASLLFGWQFKDRWTAKIGLGYQQLNFVAPIIWTAFPSQSSLNATSNLEWFTVPIQLQYNIIEGKKVSVFLAGGLTLRNATNGTRFFGGFNTVLPNELQAINNRHNMFLSIRNETEVAGTDSSRLLFGSYYEYPKWDVVLNAGVGAAYQLSKRVAVQIQAGYHFQASRGNFFGKYFYKETFGNNILIGAFQDVEESVRFRDNFFTASAGIVYHFN
jgi:hypothetical protein